MLRARFGRVTHRFLKMRHSERGGFGLVADGACCARGVHDLSKASLRFGGDGGREEVR
jgi:hypothetical protein